MSTPALGLNPGENPSFFLLSFSAEAFFRVPGIGPSVFWPFRVPKQLKSPRKTKIPRSLEPGTPVGIGHSEFHGTYFPVPKEQGGVTEPLSFPEMSRELWKESLLVTL